MTDLQTPKTSSRLGHTALQIAAFAVPELTLADGRNSTAVLAEAGIYDPAREPELVFAPLLTRWNVFARTDFGEVGERARAELPPT